MDRPGRGPIGASWVVAALLAGSGCGPTGPAGVHVTVTIDATRWDPKDLFDHVTVTATGGGKRGVACLYPDTEVDNLVEVEAPATCADTHTFPWFEPPAIENWALDAKHATIDFDFDDGDDVTVTASAAFGGGSEIASAQGEPTSADPNYPELTLELARDPKAPHLKDCGATPIEDLTNLPFWITDSCNDPLAACPAQATTKSRAAAMQCVAAGVGLASRVQNGPHVVCDGSSANQDVVWRDEADGVTAQTGAEVFVTGRFARCASNSGDKCAVTTACKPPSTSIVILTAGGRVSKDISCLPPYPVPMTFQVELPLDGTGTLALAQDPTAAAADDACFFDLYAIAPYVSK